MKPIHVLSALIVLVMLVGCSSDDGDVQVPVPETTKGFRVIGEDADAVYQFEYNVENDQSNLVNLTLETGIQPNYLTLRQLDEVISFYSFRNGFFSLLVKDLTTGSVDFYDEFYANGPNRSVAWGVNSLTNVYFGYFFPGSRNLAIQKVDFDGTNSIDVTIDFNVDVTFQPLFFEDKIFISYRDNQGNYKITHYNTLNDTLAPVLNFEEIPISFLIDDLGQLIIIKNVDEATLSRYDSNTLTFVEEVPLDFGTGFLPGPIEGAAMVDDNLYFALNYVQPSKYPYGPAVFDLISQENTIIDFEAIANTVENELETTIGITTQVYDLNEEIFLIGYAKLGNQIGGGVLQISKSGVLIKNFELPFLPTYFIKN